MNMLHRLCHALRPRPAGEAFVFGRDGDVTITLADASGKWAAVTFDTATARQFAGRILTAAGRAEGRGAKVNEQRGTP